MEGFEGVSGECNSYPLEFLDALKVFKIFQKVACQLFLLVR